MRRSAKGIGALVFVSLVLMPSLAGCASPVHGRLLACLTDPERGGLWCEDDFIPWKDSGGYVCHRPEEFEAYISGCR
jgi:hypothetical protein